MMTASVMARRVALRYAMEFNTPEALREYLKDHPNADPKNHSVKKHDNGASKEQEAEAKDEKGKDEKEQSKSAPRSVPKSKPLANPKEASRVGVSGKQVPPPPNKLPEIPNLREDEREIEHSFNDQFLKHPEEAAAQFLKAAAKDHYCFETDGAKNLFPGWSRDDLPPDEPGKPINKERAEFRGKYNALLHQAANAIAKRAFVSRLDEIAKMPEDKRKVLVTSGGVAAGKGSALSSGKGEEAKKMASATWDAAGEQNATENEWVLEECKKRGIRPTFLFVHADPKQAWPGVVQRAKGIGRMVDAQLFTDSYVEGAKNFKDFHDKHKDEADFIFGVYQGRDENGKPKPAKMMDEMPDEALKIDPDEVYEYASKYMDDHKSELPGYIYEGATFGRRAFKADEEK